MKSLLLMSVVSFGCLGSVLSLAVARGTPVPDPASLALFGAALVGLGLFRRHTQA